MALRRVLLLFFVVGVVVCASASGSDTCDATTCAREQQSNRNASAPPPRAVRVALHASWVSTSPHAEAVGWLAMTCGQACVWAFLDKVAASPRGADAEAEYRRVLAAAGEASGPVLEWALSARVTSPRAALHAVATRQLVEQAGAGGDVADNLLNAGAFLLAVHDGRAAILPAPKVNGHPLEQIPPEMAPTATDILSPACAAKKVVEAQAQSDVPVLYADVTSDAFVQWYNALDDTCYALRLWARQANNPPPVALQGYAVHAAIKATEYKVVDDRKYARLFHDAKTEDLPEGVAEPQDATLDMDAFEAPLVGYAATLYVARAPDSLVALRNVAEDAPVVLGDISREHEASPKERRQANAFADAVRTSTGGADALIINGRVLHTSNAVAQSLTNTLRCLAAVQSAESDLKEAGLDDAQAADLLHSGGEKDNTVRMDLGADDIVVWYNDLTKDRRYNDWKEVDDDKYATLVEDAGSDFDSLVKTRANLLNVIIALDAGDTRQHAYLGVPEQIVRGNIPIRVGIVLVPNDGVSRLMAAAFHYCRLEWGIKKAVAFLAQINAVLEYMGAAFTQIPINEQIVQIAFQQVAGATSSITDIIQSNDGVKEALDKSTEWAERLGLYTSSKSEDDAADGDDVESKRGVSIVATLNGILLDDVVADILPTALAEQKRIASNSAGVTKTWMDDPKLVVIRRIGAAHLAKNQPRDFLEGNGAETRRITAAQLRAHATEVAALEYTAAKAIDEMQGAVSVWLASCNHESSAHASAADLLQQLTNGDFTARTNARVALLPAGSLLANEAALCATRPNGTALLLNGRIIDLTATAENDFNVASLEAEVADEYVTPASRAAARYAATVDPWRVAVAAAAAVAALDSACTPAEGAKADALHRILSATDKSDLAAELLTPNAAEVRKAITVNPLTVVAVCDPLGSDAPAAAAFLRAINEAFPNAFTALAVVPGVGTREHVPNALRVFRRFVLEPRTSFVDNKPVAPGARFARLPQSRILTFDVRQPRAWFIAPSSVNDDLDNVILSALPHDAAALQAVYTLQALLVEGSCVDERRAPPQGLQLALGAAHTAAKVDTTVMANLGYFQLRVPQPGAWNLALQGASAEIFAVDSVDDRLSAFYGLAAAQKHTFRAAKGSFTVTVDSLDGACGTLLRVSRRPGMQGRKLLGSKANSMVGSARNLFKRVMRNKQPKEPVINVFSVASGHLYERFTKIMILSVTKHASRPVKFWLLENYLSPAFKKFLPRFAKRRGFNFQFVTYRWPGWLREQSEKQRVIWAYKILFLDVLFPLDVTRIIFVDADQVARADLADLMDIDLHGAPYGYVPFCDSRPEVDGYRFWKDGFWAKTLGKQNYRISALYVVDLERLRATAAGDTLRSMYHSLSADPNSLSNLDQDLPNYASAVPGSSGVTVPIFDLPQDWLWCESWCSDESKPNAKTIDLCNNPMTKEPKLVSARRIIKEWPTYDDEVHRTTQSLYQEIVDETMGSDVKENVEVEHNDDGGDEVKEEL